MNALLAEIRYAVRMLVRNLRSTLLAGVILGLAIGGSAAIFALVDAAFLRPLGGVSAPERLVRFERVQPGLSATNFSYPDYLAYRDQNGSFSGLATQCTAPFGLSGNVAQRIRGDLVSGNYFSVLGVRPAVGRLLGPGDDAAAGANAIAVLSYALWRRAFGSDGAIAGKSIMLNAHPFTVIGVADPNFTGTQVGQPDEIWIPLSMQSWGLPRLSAGIMNNRAAGWIDIFGRLKPGVSLAQAQADTATIAERLAKDYPVTNGHRSVRLLAGLGIDPDDQQDVGRLLALLSGAVAILLMTAAANVATLLLARGIDRQREIAVRVAIGGSPAQIVRQLGVEALLLSLVAGLFGVLVMPWTNGLIGLFRNSSPVLRGMHPGFDWRVAAFLMMVVAGTGILLGLAPALETLKIDVAGSLKQTSRTVLRRGSLKQQVLIICQLSLSFLLLTGTGLMLKTMHRLRTIAPGFDAHKVVLMSLDVGIQGYTQARGIQFVSRLIDRLEGLPAIESASVAQSVPPQEFGSRVSVFHPGEMPPLEVLRGREFELGLRVDANFIAPYYFRTLEIPILSGRDFGEHDDENAPGVAIVNQALAERMWPGQNAVGKRIVWPTFEGPPRPPATVIGVAGNTRQRVLALRPPMVLYVPIAQGYVPAVMLLVRGEGKPPVLTRQIQQQIRLLDKTLPVFRIQTMDEHVSDSLWRERAALGMIGCFAALSVMIAAIGLYGVVSQWVLQRMHDIGIRMALGASRGDVLKLVLRHGFALVVRGAITGLLCTIAVAPLASAAFARLSYGVKPADSAVIAGVTLLLVCIAVSASVAPAFRALRADPASALRAE